MLHTGSSAGRSSRQRVLALAAALLCSGLPLVGPAVRAQSEPPAAPAPTTSAFDANSVRTLLARGDAAVAANNLVEARRLYDEARTASRNLVGFYRSIAGAFRGLDARIPREMDDKGRQALDLLTQSNLRLAALLRRQGQPEVAIPLLVEVLTAMTPASEQGRKAYQQLVELGFVTTPYAGGTGS